MDESGFVLYAILAGDCKSTGLCGIGWENVIKIAAKTDLGRQLSYQTGQNVSQKI